MMKLLCHLNIAFNMKKITNKSLQAALLRGAVLVSGSMATVMVALFCNTLSGVVLSLILGTVVTVLIDDIIVENSKN